MPRPAGEFVVAGAPSLFAEVRAAHEPLVRFFEPLTVGPLNPEAARDAVVEPLVATGVEFDPEVVRDIVELSGGRPYYLQGSRITPSTVSSRVVSPSALLAWRLTEPSQPSARRSSRRDGQA